MGIRMDSYCPALGPFEWLEKAFQKKEPDIYFIKNDEFFDGVRTDPRYLDIVKRLGLQ